MESIIEKLENQLEIEKKSAMERLTGANLDSIYKLTGAICNLKKMDCDWKDEPVAEVAESIIQRYSNGRYDHNIDALYDAYMQEPSFPEPGSEATAGPD